MYLKEKETPATLSQGRFYKTFTESSFWKWSLGKLNDYNHRGNGKVIQSI